MRLALIASPFVGPSTWSWVAAEMERAQAVHYGAVTGPDWYDGMARRVVAQADGTPWIAVLHSGAGPMAPSLAAFAENLRGFIFVDAVLPHPTRSAADVAPPAQIEQFRRAASSEGLLPRWDQWFPPAALEAWIPDARMREAILADIPVVPLAFLEAQAPDRTGWEELPAMFVRLSDGYENNAARAERRGWTVRRIEANHLAMVSRSAEVIAALTSFPGLGVESRDRR